MKRIFSSLINKIAAPFIGKGYVDKFAPFLVSFYEWLYVKFQKNEIAEVSIPNNARLLVNAKDTHVGMYLLSKGEFEPVETEEFLAQIQPGSTVFDVGANAGYYAVLAGKSAVQGRVYAFEPDRRNFDLLVRNMELNSLQGKVEPCNIALGKISTEVEFKEHSTHMGKSSVKNFKSSYKIKMQTLDQFCLEKGIEKIDVMKLDIEGLETDVLYGGREILVKSPNLKLFVEYNVRSLKEYGLGHTDFMAALGSVGLKPTKIFDEVRKRTLDYSEESLRKILKVASYTNLLCEK